MSSPAILVLGAGPAGLAAAEAASAGGRQVLLVDENQGPGGQVWRGGSTQWTDRRATVLWKRLQDRPNVTMMFGTRLVSPAGAGLLLAERGATPQVLAWERAVICGGARELLLPFPGWTLPGVTGAGGLQALVKCGMPIAGKRVVIGGTGPLLLAVADVLRRRGAMVVAIVEHQSTQALARFAGKLAVAHQAKFMQAAALFWRLGGIPYCRDAHVRQARGDERLRSVLIDHRGVDKELRCDFLACGFGLVPALESASLFGCVTAQGRVQVDAAQRTSVDGVWAAGESTGIGGVDKALAEGRIAGLAAVGLAPTQRERGALISALSFARRLAQAFPPPPVMQEICRAETIVCRCEDVRAGALAGHADWRTAKLQTRVGMGACQGRVCGAACAFLYGWETTGARPPLFPVSAATLARVGASGDM